jgi:predicted O-methyltransferase YrrM
MLSFDSTASCCHNHRVDEQRWSLVDDYVAGLLVREDEPLKGVLRRSEDAGLPAISVTPAHGKLLNLLARIQKARRILEIGTLGGYSTIWLARALEAGGRVITLEVDSKHAEVARSNLEQAGVSDRVDIRVGPALESLPQLIGEAPFDLVFIDADKPSTPKYFEWALRLSRPATLILVDNVVQHGRLTESDSDDANVKGMRQLCELVAAERRVSATVIQTVGAKGYDGLLVALVGNA